MDLARILCVSSLALVACSKRREEPAAPVVVTIATAQTHGCELRAELVPEKTRIAMGESLHVDFRVTTDCAEPLEVLIVADSGNSIQRPNSFRVSAVDAKGRAVQTIQIENDQGGGEGLRAFGREHPFEQRLSVAQWLTFPAPGRYTLSVKKGLAVGKGRPDLDWVDLEVSTPIEVTPR